MPFLIRVAWLLAFSAVIFSEDAFRITVKTDNPGTSASTDFTLPLVAGASYDATVAWGDGTSQPITAGGDLTHRYTSAGTYTVAITENSASGGFPRIFFNNTGDCQKILRLDNWGRVHWSSFAHAFHGCTNLVITATDHATARTAAVSDFTAAWSGCSSLTSFPPIDTSGGVIFSEAWSGCTDLRAFPAITTSSGTTFTMTWNGCYGLVSFPLLDFTAATSLVYAWNACSNLSSFPAITTRTVTNFTAAWAGCSRIQGFPLLDMTRMGLGHLCMSGVTMDESTYDDLLIDLRDNSLYRLPPGLVTLDGGNSRFTGRGAAARSDLIANGWTIVDGGPAVPRFTSRNAVSVVEGAVLTYAITATNQPTSYSASNLPAFLSLTGSVISGQAPITGSPAIFTITVHATNIQGTSDLDVDIHVNLPGAPVIAPGQRIIAIRQQTLTPQQIVATNSPTASTSTSMPNYLYLNTSGQVEGYPLVVGRGTARIGASNAQGTGFGEVAIDIVFPDGSGAGPVSSGTSGISASSAGGCGFGGVAALVLLIAAGIHRRRAG